MLLLTQVTDFLELQTGSALSTDWTVSFLDVNYATSSFLPGSAEGNVATAATTQIVPPPPDANTQRQLKYLSIVNRDAALPQTVVIDKNSGAAYNLTGPIVLNAGDTLQYVDSRGFSVLTAQGQEKFAGMPGAAGAAGPSGVGAPGLDGDAGEDAMHIPGPPGAPGAAGASGAVGPPGSGPPGMDGSDGEDALHIPGPPGVPGGAGAVGPTGPAVYLDADALEGDIGPPGIPGTPGVQGSPGATGAQGTTAWMILTDADPGDDGQPGPPGLPGAPGAAGGQGATGVAGYAIPGADGDPGDEGMPIPGNPGSQGLQGATGAAGPSGFDIMYQEITLEDQWPQGLGSNYPGDNYTFNGLVTVNGVVVANGLITVTAGGLTLLSSTLTLAANTASNHPLKFTTGTLNTTATAGVAEYDGVAHYFTNETTAGRGLVPVEQYFHLTAAGTAITTIANFFGTTSNIPLVAGAYYEIEIVCFFTMGATGSIVTVTLTNSAAPTYMDLCYEMCPITGVVAPPGAATLLAGQIVGGVTAAQTIVTGLLVALSQQYMRMRISLANGTGTSLKIQFAETTTATGLTPNIGSYWRCKRIPAANVGTFAA
jgi:hypothetical protein